MKRATAKEAAAIAAALAIPALKKGEKWAGILLDAKGKPSHHIVLLAGQRDNFTWEEAKKWAKDQGGELPTRKEQALLFANLAGEFEERWYWSGEPYAGDAGYAWMQNFSSGYQYSDRTSYKNRCRAVRRVPIQ